MKLVELFLNETTEEDRAIISLAPVIHRQVRRYEDYIDPASDDAIAVGKIGDFANTPIEGFEDINIEIQSGAALGRRIAEYNKEEYEGKQPRGVWLNTGPTIVLNSDHLSDERLKSTIVHELRHAMDDLKSQGRASSSTRYRSPKKKEFRKKDPYADHNYPYLAEPAEINARFSQVQDELIDYISKNSNLPPDQLRQRSHRALKNLLIKYRISLLFPEKTESKDYKRLVKRGVDMVDKEINYISQLD